MEEIRRQIVFLLGSFLSGVAVFLAYEVVNVFRGLFRPGVLGKLVMDVLFFLVSGVCVFRMVFLCNNGTLRSFFVVAFAAGALLYRETFGVRLSGFIVRVIRWVFHQFSRPFAWMRRKFRKMKHKIEKIYKKREKNS